MENISDKEKSFARGTIIAAAIAALVIFLVGGLVISNYAQIQANNAVEEARVGKYDRAYAILEELDAEKDADVLSQARFDIAVCMYENGDYDTALEQFLAMQAHDGSAEMISACRYQKALGMMDNGDFYQASSILYNIAEYKDALEQYKQCKYSMAEQAYAEDDWRYAVQLFWDIKDYKDASERARSITAENTGTDDIESVIADSGNLSAEELDLLISFNEKQEEFPEGRIALGDRHSLGLRNDGTVIACGDNEQGQCDVDEWTDIVYVAAGAYHSVGLRADGTVVAVGRNQEGQCNVVGWTNIVQISAGGYNTIGLTADGTVKICGSYDYTAFQELIDVQKVAAGNYGAAVIMNDYTVITEQKSAEMPVEGIYIDISLSTGYCAALRLDGTTVSTFEALDGWTDMVRISAGSTAFLAVDSQGMLKAHFFRDSDAFELDSTEPIRGVCAGGTHHLLLTDSGRVLAYGNNDFGQCDTSEWKLF